jgi:signal transduction histidine kinase
MQVFLNLSSNSIRALSGKVDAAFTVTTNNGDTGVELKFLDNGGGVSEPERLFHPFQAGAEATGLGLYLSRAFMRSFGGELRYHPLPGHACFTATVIKPSQAEQD